MLRRLLEGGTTPAEWSPRRIWLTAFLAFFALTTAWALASPLTGVPDEPSHMVKAAATVRGQLTGVPTVVTVHEWGVPKDIQETGYRLPSSYALLADMHSCYFAHPLVPASCAAPAGDRPGTAIAGTAAGANNPLYYLAVGWPSLLSHGTVGMYGMRLVSAGICSALLASAVLTAAQWSRRRRFPLVGVLAAATPMVMFLDGSVNPNSVEASSAILLWIAMLAMLTDPQPELTDRLLTRAGVATIALVSVRQLGPAWALGILICGTLAGQSGTLRALLRRPRTWLWTAAVAVAGVGSFLWTARYSVLGTSAVTYPNLTFGTAAQYTFHQSGVYIRSMVGIFGWLEVKPSHTAQMSWLAAVAVLVLAAAWRAKLRELVSLAGLCVAVVAIPVVAQGRQAVHLGYIWQGRYLLAVAVGVPLLAAAVLANRTPVGRRGWLGRVPRIVMLGVAGVTLFVGLEMFLTTLRRYAVGDTGSWFTLHPAWSPPGTVYGAVALYVAGAALLAWCTLASPQAAVDPADAAVPETRAVIGIPAQGTPPHAKPAKPAAAERTGTGEAGPDGYEADGPLSDVEATAGSAPAGR